MDLDKGMEMKFLRFVLLAFSSFLILNNPGLAQDQSGAYYQAGNTLYGQKNYDQAIRYYQAAVQVNPQMWQADQGLGNCYYAKGDKATALASYQKALDINPNNPQLAGFVQSLRSQVTTSSATSTGAAVAPAGQTSTGTSKNLELDFGAGAGLASNVSFDGLSGDFGFGFGGKARGLFLISPDLGLGGTLGFYTFSKSYPGSTTSITTSSLEITGSAKYKFDAGGIKPYLIGGLGISMLSAGSGSGSASETDPIIQVGGGAEIPGGNDMSFFAEVKYDMILGGGQNGGPSATYSYIPVEVGVAFGL